jgi:hypothetical protein
MTSGEQRIEDEVERTLRAFDDDAVLDQNPFLLSRIKAVRESRRSHSSVFGVHVGLYQALMLLVVLVNLLTAVYWYESKTRSVMHEKIVSALRNDFQIDEPTDSF